MLKCDNLYPFLYICGHTFFYLVWRKEVYTDAMGVQVRKFMRTGVCKTNKTKPLKELCAHSFYHLLGFCLEVVWALNLST